MEENSFQGNLNQIPLPRLLFLIWQKENSGLLLIQREKEKKDLYFEKGNLFIERSSFPEKDFLKTLVRKKIMTVDQQKRCESHASQNKVSLLKALIECHVLSPSQLWKLIETFFEGQAFALFDWAEASFLFDLQALEGHLRLSRIETPNFILQGIRQMRNFALIEAWLPPENEYAQILSPPHLHLLSFKPHEIYLLQAIDKSSLKEVYDSSEIGKKETQKAIFTFLCLGIIGTSSGKFDLRSSPEFSAQAVERILSSFNEKCSYIYKYISKEIGPVALNVLEKTLEEVKSNLSPLFQEIELNPDGTFETKSILKTNRNLCGREELTDLLRDLNEILAAEVLTVKKTLGNEHESSLVKNLEKIGEII